RGYESHVRVHLIPHLGDVVLDKLRPHHIEDLIDKIKQRNADIATAKASPDPDTRASVRGMRPTGPATISRIRASLRKAFNDALAREVVSGVTNPATLVKTPNARAKPIVWEPERVARWKATGKVPARSWSGPTTFSSSSWTTPPSTPRTCTPAAPHGLPRTPSRRSMRTPRRRSPRRQRRGQHRQPDRHPRLRDPPEAAQERRRQPRGHPRPRHRRRPHRIQGPPRRLAPRRRKDWPDTGLFSVRPDGNPWHPNAVTQRFRRLVKQARLPPIRLHDLRHGAATLALDAGIDIKVVSDQLGHSTTTLTRDTYQSVVKRLHHEAATAVADRIKNKGRRTA
ncbi:tyrosine-type recombinase/integrase, partial [Micromonospora sp. U56]|uniref:tyrosine-type recombinase/integrase n=1 Tax=Micromonospora sp. U56 TaxID=2824900 RepID=UPI001FFD327D